MLSCSYLLTLTLFHAPFPSFSCSFFYSYTALLWLLHLMLSLCHYQSCSGIRHRYNSLLLIAEPLCFVQFVCCRLTLKCSNKPNKTKQPPYGKTGIEALNPIDDTDPPVRTSEAVVRAHRTFSCSSCQYQRVWGFFFSKASNSWSWQKCA